MNGTKDSGRELDAVGDKGANLPKGAERSLAGHYRWLMLGGGSFQLVLGLGILLVVEFLLVEQIDIAYPYLNQSLVVGMEVLAYLGFVAPGAVLVAASFWAGKLSRVTPGDVSRGELRKLRLTIGVASIFLLVGFPLGTAVGVTLIREMWLLETPA
ncbi:MAG: hypothetical protein ACTSU5_00830 [Promethearchaeota archaeon]